MELAEDKRAQEGSSLRVKARPAGLSVPEKAVITATCIEAEILPTINPTQFNYPIDIMASGMETAATLLKRSDGDKQAPCGPCRMDTSLLRASSVEIVC